MTRLPLLACLLVATLPLAACKRSLDAQDVREFVDLADDAARKRFAPEICKLRGENFTLEVSYQPMDSSPPSEMKIGRGLFCREAGRFARLRQYRLERRSLEIHVAEDARTATAIAEYVETRPYYGDNLVPATPDDFRDFVVVESVDESVIGIEGGDLVFLSTRVTAEETDTIAKSKLDIPYD